MQPKFKRILIKLSGESLSESGLGIQVQAAMPVIEQVKLLVQMGVEVAIVIGGGNILRGGRADFGHMIKRRTADAMGMMATMINAMALRDILVANGVCAVALSSKSVEGCLMASNADFAEDALNEGKVVIFSGGTGNPFVTTDTASSLRAIEIGADLILKATTVDGVYDKDPNRHVDAVKYSSVTFDEALAKNLQVMDMAAFLQCREFNVSIYVFNMNEPNALVRVVQGEQLGTLVHC